MARDMIPAIIVIVATIVRTDGGMIHVALGAIAMMVMRGLPFKDQNRGPSRQAGEISVLSLFRK